MGRLADAIDAKNEGSASKYAVIETKNGEVVTIRLADHNATISNFDHKERDNGISIVISRKPNEGLTNDGDAHIVEFFYSDKALKKAEGNPYSQIARSMQQVLYSGEYKDTTGLAVREEVNAPKFYRTSTGEVYGFAYKGKIYIDPRIAGADTPIHEYTHLWADAMKLANPKTWKRIVGIMEKQTKLWNDIAKQYPELEDKDTLAAEVLAHYSGSKGAERLQKLIDETDMSNASLYAQTIAAVHRMQKVLDTFWRAVAEKIGFRFSNAQTVADTILKDLLDENHTLASPATVRRDSVAPEMQEVQKRDTFYSNAQRAVEGPFKGVTWTISWKLKNGLKLEPKEKAALKAAGIPYEGIADIKPIGKSSQFGNIYLQFKGKVKEAFDFMMQKKDGFLKAVFHRDEVGDIGLVWGNGKAGLYHIILKHVINYDDFSSVNDVVNTIDDVIKTGQYSLQKDGRVAFTKDNYRVAIKKSEEGNWIISALDTSRKKKEKKRARCYPFTPKHLRRREWGTCISATRFFWWQR